MQKYIQMILDIFRYHKKEVAAALGSMIFFLLVLFPYNDLGTVVATKITEMTNNQIYVQFDELGFGLSPQPGVKMKNVFLQTTFIPSLRMDSLFVAPSIKGLLTFKPGVTVYARGLLGGNVGLSSRGGKKTDRDQVIQIIDLKASQIALKQIQDLLELPVPIRGELEIKSVLEIDPDFREQPSGEVTFEIDQFHLPASTVETPMGPITLPDIRISSIQIDGRMTAGQFFVDEGIIGSESDSLNGRIKGHWSVNFKKKGNTVVPKAGSYEIKLDLQVSRQLHGDLELMFLLLGKCKSSTPKGFRYLCKISGSGSRSTPRITSIRSI